MNFSFLIISIVASLTNPFSNNPSSVEHYGMVTNTLQFERVYQDTTKQSSQDSIIKPNLIVQKQLTAIEDSSLINDAEIGLKERFNDKINERSILEILSVPRQKKIFSWKYNKNYLEYDRNPVDTTLWLNHLFYPQQRKKESYTYLGNLGAPSLYDHFFSREASNPFLLTRYYNAYAEPVEELNQFNVRTPFTYLTYTTAGKRSQAEQMFRALHTQNVNKHLNIGVSYSHYGTKGVFENQSTRNNLISGFSSYHKGNVFGQVNFINKVYNNEENGGIQNFNIVPDTIETKIIPVWLKGAKSVSRERSIFAIVGYTLLNIKEYSLDTAKTENYIPLISTKLQVKREAHSRVFLNSSTNPDFFENSYINPYATYDSIALINWDTKLIVEINQFAKIPLMPGLRGWVGYEYADYYMFKPQDYIFASTIEPFYSAHFGLAAFSDSPYLSYRGAIKTYFSGYKADDKELKGEVRVSFWRDLNMPQLRGKIVLAETTPDIFYRSFFSNHYKWDNNFSKEKTFQLEGVFEIPKWNAELGYNIAYIQDYIFFNRQSLPEQTKDMTITSAFAQNNLKIGKGINFFNRIIWQINSNKEALSLPTLIGFSALYYEGELVKNALTTQIGLNVTYRTNFFADAYNPAIGQFYNQRLIEIGNYPVIDIYANFKWKRAILFAKYEHLNQGYPNKQYFSAFSYPINPQIFKFGVSWIFYD
jgi:hypothetical protein